MTCINDIVCLLIHVLLSSIKGPNSQSSITALRERDWDIHPCPQWNRFIWLCSLKPLPTVIETQCVHSVTSSPAKQKYPILAIWSFPIVVGFGTTCDLI